MCHVIASIKGMKNDYPINKIYNKKDSWIQIF
jgi:hypothetical protein